MASSNSFELSAFLARPIELYLFVINGTKYGFTSSRKDFLGLDGLVYKSKKVKRSKINRTAEYKKKNVNIEITNDNEVSQMLKELIPGSPIDVYIYRTHKGATTQDVVFSGRVASSNFTTTSGQFECISFQSVLDNFAVRKSYSRYCTHALYSKQCSVLKEDFRREFTVTGLSNDKIVIGVERIGDAAPFFIGGFIEFNGEFRTIINQDDTANTLTIASPFKDLKLNSTFSAFAGCNKTLTTCTNKFNNQFNYFGFIHIPKENVFQKDIS